MILWMVLTLMISLSVAGLSVPLVRRYEARAARQGNIAILKAQLDQVSAQEQSGALTAAEAEGMRTEISRRILAEGKASVAPARPFDPRMLPWAAVALAGIVALTATGLYALVGHPAPVAVPDMVAPAPAQDQTQPGGQHPIADINTMIGRLEAKLKQTPDDAEGWRMLGWSYLSVNRAGDAATAYGQAAALDPSKSEYRSAQGDALVQAADGKVTPQAMAAFQAALKIDPADARALYFVALHDDQQGLRDKAMDEWIALVKNAPPGATWVGEVRSFVERTAKERNIDLTGRLPPAPMAPPADAAAPGPTQDQVAAAGQMSEADRQAMIHGMVDKLAASLKANPQDAEGWQKLMRARMVLGDADAAASAYRDAQKAFSGSPGQLAALRDAAKSLGVPGA